MKLSSETARSLIEPSVPSGETLTDFAVGGFAISGWRVAAMIFGPGAVLVVVLLALPLDTRNPVVPAVLTVGLLGLMAVSIGWLVRRQRYCVVGLTANRLLIVPLVGSTKADATRVANYPLATLRGVKHGSRYIGGSRAGYRAPWLELAGRRIYFFAFMANNEDAARRIASALAPAAA